MFYERRGVVGVFVIASERERRGSTPLSWGGVLDRVFAAGTANAENEFLPSAVLVLSRILRYRLHKRL